MALSIDDAEAFLPKYLSPKERSELFEELRKFPEGMNYYTQFAESAILQGDGWNGISFFDSESGRLRNIRVCVLTNTCDVFGENERHLPQRIIVAPLVSVSNFEALLRRYGVSEASITSKVATIRRQEVSDIFFLPKGHGLEEDFMLMLNDVQSQALSRFVGDGNNTRLFTLSQAGFWLFLLKLAIHFCRANEGVSRRKAKDGAENIAE